MSTKNSRTEKYEKLEIPHFEKIVTQKKNPNVEKFPRLKKLKNF